MFIVKPYFLVTNCICPGAWILTGGLKEGVSRCVGEAVKDHGAAASTVSQKKVTVIGVTPWGLVHNRQQLVNAQVLNLLCFVPLQSVKCQMLLNAA